MFCEWRNITVCRLEQVRGREQHRSEWTRDAVSIDCDTKRKIVVHEAFAVIARQPTLGRDLLVLMNQLTPDYLSGMFQA
ncbi:hypothetical protein AS156_35950 [Bradyrhizobium macuxiense]|uniref:Uncharacterized protein n=1 Tax=Bradyrhizobium macuxiense TaxID=1755647 RepID=A0A109K012_9BRAD|nr:hypothetical protein AS156_35950 [Bradyrhizobium macuxiense]